MWEGLSQLATAAPLGPGRASSGAPGPTETNPRREIDIEDGVEGLQGPPGTHISDVANKSRSTGCCVKRNTSCTS